MSCNMILQTFLCSAALAATMSCAPGDASDNQPVEDPLPVFDSAMTAALGDSICDILANAKIVKAEILGYKDSTLQAVEIKELTKEQVAILDFLLNNPANVATNENLFGKFMPNISFRFICKKQEIYVVLDFGLRKWQFKDVNGQLLKEFDLRSTEFLRFAHTLFPDDQFINALLNQ